MASGSQPPSTILSELAARNAQSISGEHAEHGDDEPMFHCHCRAATRLTWNVSITITPVTAMP